MTAPSDLPALLALAGEARTTDDLLPLLASAVEQMAGEIAGLREVVEAARGVRLTCACDLYSNGAKCPWYYLRDALAALPPVDSVGSTSEPLCEHAQASALTGETFTCTCATSEPSTELQPFKAGDEVLVEGVGVMTFEIIEQHRIWLRDSGIHVAFSVEPGCGCGEGWTDYHIHPADLARLQAQAKRAGGDGK